MDAIARSTGEVGAVGNVLKRSARAQIVRTRMEEKRQIEQEMLKAETEKRAEKVAQRALRRSKKEKTKISPKQQTSKCYTEFCAPKAGEDRGLKVSMQGRQAALAAMRRVDAGYAREEAERMRVAWALNKQKEFESFRIDHGISKKLEDVFVVKSKGQKGAEEAMMISNQSQVNTVPTNTSSEGAGMGNKHLPFKSHIPVKKPARNKLGKSQRTGYPSVLKSKSKAPAHKSAGASARSNRANLQQTAQAAQDIINRGSSVFVPVAASQRYETPGLKLSDPIDSSKIIATRQQEIALNTVRLQHLNPKTWGLAPPPPPEEPQSKFCSKIDSHATIARRQQEISQSMAHLQHLNPKVWGRASQQTSIEPLPIQGNVILGQNQVEPLLVARKEFTGKKCEINQIVTIDDFDKFLDSI